jgi:hypothetical protein
VVSAGRDLAHEPGNGPDILFLLKSKTWSEGRLNAVGRVPIKLLSGSNLCI